MPNTSLISMKYLIKKQKISDYPRFFVSLCLIIEASQMQLQSLQLVQRPEQARTSLFHC